MIAKKMRDNIASLLLPGTKGTPPTGDFVSAQKNSSGKNLIGILNLPSRDLKSAEISIEGHSIAFNPVEKNLVVLFGQPPSRVSLLFDVEKMAVIRIFDCAPGNYFYGHGVFSRDGKHLFVSEHVNDDTAGIITIRDTAGFRLIGQLNSHGNAPHELLLTPDGSTMVIANGGITEKNDGTPVANADNIFSSLCYVEIESGKLLAKDTLVNTAMSIRHIKSDGLGNLGVGLANFGVKNGDPCVAVRNDKADLKLVDRTGNTGREHQRVLSVVVDAASDTVAATHPEAGVVSFWSLGAGTHKKTIDVPGPQGIEISADRRYFVVTTESDRIRFYSVSDLKERRVSPLGITGLNSKHLAIRPQN